MKKILFSMVISAFSYSYAQIPQVNVQNFSAEYLAPSGKASALNFEYEGKDYGQSLDIEMQAGELVLTAETEEFRLSKLPEMITSAKSLNIEEISLVSDAKSISLDSNVSILLIVRIMKNTSRDWISNVRALRSSTKMCSICV
jgi:hypothetical protein